jgi:hypothetical protein
MMKYSILAICFLVLVSLACGVSATPTHIPTKPIYVPPTSIIPLVKGYVPVDCSSIQPPQGYNDQFCYWIDPSTDSFAAVYYKGLKIKGIATFIKIDASDNVLIKASHFLDDATSTARWNDAYVNDCIDTIELTHSDVSKKCGNITIKIYVSSNRYYLVMALFED